MQCTDFAGATSRAAGRTPCIHDSFSSFPAFLIPLQFANEMNLSSGNLTRRPWYRPSLTTQIMIGLVVGALIGWLQPAWGNNVYFLRDIFINLIKSIIAPLVFSTIVVGIAGAGALKKVGRMGIKALVYF